MGGGLWGAVEGFKSFVFAQFEMSTQDVKWSIWSFGVRGQVSGYPGTFALAILSTRDILPPDTH